MRNNIASLLLILLVALFYGCSEHYIDNVERGAGYQYQYGYPELRLVTAGYYSEMGEPVVEVSGEVVYGGLIYSENENGNMQANIRIDIEITEEGSGQVVAQKTISDSLISQNDGVIYSQELYRFGESFTASSGTFDIQVTLTDEGSGKQTVRNSTTSIPDPQQQVVSISEIKILGKDNTRENPEYIPITTYDVPGHLDSLKFIVQVTNTTDSPIEVDSKLKKFKSDTSIAWSMSIQNYPRSSIRYQGIEYDEFDIIQSSVREISQPGNVFIEYSFGELDRGNYRLEINVDGEDDNDELMGREFGIKSPHYPAVNSAYKMAESLKYIMSDKEYKALMSIKNKDSLKSAIDRFWLSNISNTALARQVISMYYSRVEEANKQFSNFKEGWKTDPGMIYILFGPPWSVNDVYNFRMIWSYTSNLDDPEKNFLFRVSDIKSKYFPFDNYILERDITYHQVEYRQKQRWRTGSILTVDL